MFDPNNQQKQEQQIAQIKGIHETQTEQENYPNKFEPLLQQIYPFKKKKPIVKHIFPKCIVCKKPGKYQCPKCKVRYCSLQHYKSHNLFCSQQFYQQNVKQHLKGMKVGNQEKQKTKKMLQEHEKALYQQEIIQTISEERFEQILKDLQQNGVQNVKLSHRQQIQFATFIKQWVKQNGERPFWEVQDGLSRMFIEEQPNQSHSIQIEQYNKSQYPQIITYRQLLRERIQKVIPFNALNIKDNAEVSNKLIYHITYLAYLTTILFRFFDGQSNTNEFRDTFSNLSEIIFPKNPKKSQNQINKFEQIVVILKSKILKHNYQLQSWCNIAMQDCKTILRNKYIVIQLLYRIQDSFLSKNNPQQTKAKTRIIKKVQFLISYVLKNWSNKKEQIEKIANQIDCLLQAFTAQLKEE